MLETKVAAVHFYKRGTRQLGGRVKKDSAEIRYLLGTISPDEAVHLEESFFADQAKFEQLEIAEDELIDGYVRNQLSPEETQRFKARLLTSARISERVNFARALAEKADAYDVPRHRQVRKEKSPVPWWQNFLSAQPALGVAFAACFLIFAVGGLISIAAWLRLRNESERITSERAAVQKQKDELDKRALELESKTQQLAADVQKQRDELAQERRRRIEEWQRPLDRGQPDRGLTSLSAIVFLSPGLSRSPDESPQLTISPDTSTARISLGLESNDYRTYQVVLRDANRSRIFSEKRLRVPNPARPQIDFSVPARVLTPGTYLINVSGRTPTGALEEVADYTFRVTKK